MRYFKFLFVALILITPLAVTADVKVPGAAEWYLHVDLQKMKSERAGKSIYTWLQDEAFDELEKEAGIAIDKELNSLTAFSVAGEGPIVVLDGDFSQATKDKVMTFLMAEGDIKPLKSSGKNYYRFGEGEKDFKGDNYDISIESFEDGGWVSFDVNNKLLITGAEGQMHNLLKNKGRVAGLRSNTDALLILTAEKTLLQAGMQSGMIAGDGDSGWESNILRNTEQVAFLVAAAANKLAIEAKLITSEPDMANSLASVVRGLISLASFSDDMDAEAIAMLRGTKVEAKGNSLSISLAVDPELVVAAIED